jgi:HEAT repeat protein
LQISNDLKRNSIRILILVLLLAGSIVAPQSGDDYALYLDAKQFFYSKDYDSAIVRFKKLVTQYPQSIYCEDVVYWMAFSYEKSGLYKNAIKTYDSLATHIPNSRWADEATARVSILASQFVRGGEKKYEKYLLKGLGSSSRQIQLRSIFELALTGLPQTFPHIKKYYDQQNDPITKIKILLAIEESGSSAAIPMLQDIIRNDRDSLMRIQALQALRRIQDPQVFPIVKDFYFNTKSIELRGHALSMIEQFHSNFATPLVVDIFKQEDNTKIKKEALNYLEKIKQPKIINDVFETIPYLSSFEMKLEVIERFGNRAPQLYAPVVESVIKNESNSDVKKRVLRVVQNMSPYAMVSVVETAINDKDPEVKAFAIQLAGQMDNKHTLEFYKLTINDPNAKVRYKTLATMTSNASPALLPLLLRTLENEPVAQIRLQAIDGLAKVKNESCIPVLNYIIVNDDNNLIRGKALKLVGDLGSKKTLESVSHMLRYDIDPTLRFKAIDVLLGIGGKDAAPIFRQTIVNEDNEAIRDKMLQILFYLDPQMANEVKIELQKKYY